MSHGPEEINYERKGNCMIWAFTLIFLLIIMLIWVYNQNFQFLPQ